MAQQVMTPEDMAKVLPKCPVCQRQLKWREMLIYAAGDQKVKPEVVVDAVCKCGFGADWDQTRLPLEGGA